MYSEFLEDAEKEDRSGDRSGDRDRDRDSNGGSGREDDASFRSSLAQQEGSAQARSRAHHFFHKATLCFRAVLSVLEQQQQQQEEEGEEGRRLVRHGE